MDIAEDIEILGLCLYLPRYKTLIISDLHIGFEEALNKQGILVPRVGHIDLLKSLESVLKSRQIDTIIINGDLKHEFGTISETEWRHTLLALDLMSRYSKKIILIKGNHDTILDPIARKRDLEIKDYHIIGDVYICHGHKIPQDDDFKSSKTIIIGHEHPAISLRKDARVETYKCFLKGSWNRKTLILMPSFNPMTEGTDLLKEELLSPFLSKNLDNFRIFIISDKAYDFGLIKSLKNQLGKI